MVSVFLYSEWEPVPPLWPWLAMLLARDVLRLGFLALTKVERLLGTEVTSLGNEPAAVHPDLEDDILLTTNLTSFLSSPQACHNFKIFEVLLKGLSTPRHCSTTAS